MKLEFKHIVNYIDHDLQMIFQSKGGRIINVNGIKKLDSGTVVLSNSYPIWLHSSGFKTILRPMSDMDKMIEYKGEKFIPAVKYDLIKDSEGFFNDRFYADQCESPFVDLPVFSVNYWVFELLFDVYDLIGKDLAVNINEL